jgi:hypothetical protein
MVTFIRAIHFPQFFCKFPRIFCPLGLRISSSVQHSAWFSDSFYCQMFCHDFLFPFDSKKFILQA